MEKITFGNLILALKGIADAIRSLAPVTGRGQAVAKIERSTAYAFPSGAWTNVLLDTDVIENDPSILDCDAANNRIKILKTGVYLLTAYVAFLDNVTGDRGLRFELNGTYDANEFFMGKDATGRWRYFLILPRQFFAGDLIKLQAYQSSGAALNLTRSYLSLVFLSE